jgi:phosphopantetheine--protein transferase-like protein
MNYVDLFLLKADLSGFRDSSIAVQKKAVSDFSRRFVRQHVSKIIGVPAENLKFAYGERGKPYIKENPLYLNVSHCGNVVLAAFAPEEIGADIELVRSFNEGVVRRFFTDEERRYITLSADRSEEECRFFEIWTAKEAFLKFCGTGISGGFDFSTADENGLREEIFSPKLGTASVIHCGGRIKLTKSDIISNNTIKNNNYTAEYTISICSRNVNNVNFRYINFT